jgi:hypothetical protein
MAAAAAKQTHIGNIGDSGERAADMTLTLGRPRFNIRRADIISSGSSAIEERRDAWAREPSQNRAAREDHQRHPAPVPPGERNFIAGTADQPAAVVEHAQAQARAEL